MNSSRFRHGADENGQAQLSQGDSRQSRSWRVLGAFTSLSAEDRNVA